MSEFGSNPSNGHRTGGQNGRAGDRIRGGSPVSQSPDDTPESTGQKVAPSDSSDSVAANTSTFDPLDVELMRAALIEAERAFELGEVPIGCVIHHVPTGQRFVGHNLRETDRDPSAHAEIVAMRSAARALGSWRLVDCILAVTLEPCPMCAGAIVNARIPHVIYGTRDPKAGAVDSLYQLLTDERLNHRCRVVEGVEVEACRSLLRTFFQRQRALGKK